MQYLDKQYQTYKGLGIYFTLIIQMNISTELLLSQKIPEIT